MSRCAATDWSPWRRNSKRFTILRLPTFGPWPAIPKVTYTPEAVPEPSSTGFRRTARKKRSPSWTAWRFEALAIDAQDRIYAATAPDGKVYRVAPGAKSDAKCEVFYDPKAKYIWALAFSKAGDLLVATGDPGAVHRVTPDGHGSVLYAKATKTTCARWSWMLPAT